MGLGHQRAAHPLAHLAEGGVMVAGAPGTTDPDEARFWHQITWSYEVLSRTKALPIAGRVLYGALERILRIPPFYPLRDLSHPSFNNYIVDHLIRRGLGRSLVARVRAHPLPVIATFYAPALVADQAGLDEVSCVICDADLNRVWVASDVARSRIRYFAPCGSVRRRLRQYGVPDERIFITGFPLPRENIGGPGMETLKADLIARLGRLDPRGRFTGAYGATVASLLGAPPTPSSGRVTIAFAVGGAGAQVEIGLQIADSLKPDILDGRYRLILIAGVNRVVERMFREHLARIGLEQTVGDGVIVVREDTRPAYFDRFNALMRETDILWTKPSELSFYTGLGIPIVMAPPIGPQESRNERWLLDKGCAFPQDTPSLAREWLADLLADGLFAERAMDGFIKNRRLGVYKIEEVLATGTMARETHPLKR
jgi:hypothetical protein